MDALDVVRSSDGPGGFEPCYNIGPSEVPRYSTANARSEEMGGKTINWTAVRDVFC